MKTALSFVILMTICIASVACTKTPQTAQGGGSQTTSGSQKPVVADPARARQTLVEWLECEECTEGQLEAVVSYRQSVVPSLAATLREGPPPASIERLRLHLAATYRQLKDYERTHPESKVSMTEEQYLQTYIGNYVALYKVRAAIALGRIGGAQATEALRAALAAPENRDDVMTAVKEALAMR
jgi:hypothetical protein